MQSITALGTTQTPTGQFQDRLKQQNTTSICETKRQTHGNRIILMMLGMQILRVRGNPPPPHRNLGETQVFSTQDPKALAKIQGFGHPAQHAHKVAFPKAFGFDKKFRRKTKLRTAIYTLDWRRRICPAIYVSSSRSVQLSVCRAGIYLLGYQSVKRSFC